MPPKRRIPGSPSPSPTRRASSPLPPRTTSSSGVAAGRPVAFSCAASAEDEDEDEDEDEPDDAASLLAGPGGSGRDEDKRSIYSGTNKKLPFYTPFLYRDYRVLYCINVAEFFSSTLSTLTLLQWLYETTGDGMALGGLGIVTLAVNVPGIILGGVLADELDRKSLLSRMQMVQCVVLGFVWLLQVTSLLAGWHVYLAIACLTGARRLEDSPDRNLPRDVVRGKTHRQQPQTRLLITWASKNFMRLMGPPRQVGTQEPNTELALISFVGG